jgi:hypothetical protein
MSETDEAIVRAEARVGTPFGGKWRLDRLLGVGGMASVYAASHRNGALAAIKVLHPEYARRPEIRSRFMREGYIANTAGPGAVRVLDDDVDDDGAPYLVMELLSGETVDVRAERSDGRLSVLEVLWIASETLATLEIAHASGIIHRDLKPGNIFWTDESAIKVLDFGIARLHDNSGERTMTGTILGTPTFMAHEQALGLSSEIDARTDVWAVGAIMFHLLTGQDVHPVGEGNELVIAATRHAPPIRMVDGTLPEGVAEIVDRALAFDQADRYPSANAMREAILALASVETMRAAAGAGAGRASRPLGPAADVKPASPPTEEAREEPHAEGLATGMSDDDTLALRSLLELVEVAVLTREELEQSGEPRWKEAAKLGTFRRLETAYRQATAALENAHIGLFWNVLPEGFATKQGLLWRARPPLPPVPQQMWDAGVRMLGLLPGLTFEELGEIARLIRGDLAPFSDYATLLQSSQHPHLVYRIDPTKPGMPEHPSLSLDSSFSGRAGVLPMVDALSTSDPALRAALLHRLERVGEGQELAIGALLATAPVELAMGLCRVLVGLGTDAAREAMREGAKNPSVLVRIEALAYTEPGGEALAAELREALAAGTPEARIERLVALDVYKVKAAGPPLALRVSAGSFDMLPVDERRQAFFTLAALLPARAESLAIRLVLERRVISTAAHEATRELACEVLGRIGASKEAEAALREAVASTAKSAEKVRVAAAVALDALTARAAWRPK